MLAWLLPTLGFAIVVQILHKVYLWFWEVYWKTPTDLVKRYGKGSWCIITGGSDGIGFEFANQLAAKGFNLVLIARNEEKLNKRSSQLKTQHKGVEVQTIATDFTKNDSIEYFEGLLDQIKVDDVAMLINCAGQNCGHFMTESLEKIRDSVIVNVVPTYMLIRAFLYKYPGSAENRKAIIALSCHNNELESNTKSVITSVKHGINMLIQSEAMNYTQIGTDMLSIKPVNVTSGASNYREEDWLTCSPKELVQDSLEVLGQTDETFGCKRHIAYAWTSELIRMYFGMSAGRLWDKITNYKAIQAAKSDKKHE